MPKNWEAAFWTFIKGWNHKPFGVFDIIKPRRKVFLKNQWIIYLTNGFAIPGYLIIIFHTQTRLQNRYYHNWGRCIFLALHHFHMGNLYMVKTFPENWNSKAPSIVTLLVYVETTAQIIFFQEYFFFQDRKLKLSASVWKKIIKPKKF